MITTLAELLAALEGTDMDLILGPNAKIIVTENVEIPEGWRLIPGTGRLIKPSTALAPVTGVAVQADVLERETSTTTALVQASETAISQIPVGASVVLANSTVGAYVGSWIVLAVVDSTHIRIDLPGFTTSATADLSSGATVWDPIDTVSSADGGMNTIVTFFSVGDRGNVSVGSNVSIYGSTGGDYDGTWMVLERIDDNKIKLAMPFKTATLGANAKLAGVSISYNGLLDALRRQVFSGFRPGDIRGNFSTHEIFPEWWGLIGSTKDDGQHDIAINCAIQAFIPNSTPFHPGAPYRSFVMAVKGNIVSLAAFTYFTSRPLDLASSLSFLEGAGAGRTIIVAAKTWDQSDASWIDSATWPNVGVTPGKLNHSALIWMGSGFPSTVQSFRTGLRGVDLKCYYATWSAKGQNGTGRVSGISTKGWVEENSTIENVAVTDFSGYGIGFGDIDLNHVATVNGLAIRNFWIGGGAMRDCFPIYFTRHAGVASIESGTIDVGLVKENSSDWRKGSAAKATLTLTGPPANLDTVSIAGKTYTFRDSLGTYSDSVQRIVPLSGTPVPGQDFSSATTPHRHVIAVLNDVASPPRIDFTAIAVGAEWNNIALQMGGITNGAFSGTSLTGGSETAKATGSFWFTGTARPDDGSYIVVGPKAYTFKDILTTPAVEGEVLRGTAADCLKNVAAASYGAITREGQGSWANLIKAINGTGVDGVDYLKGTGTAIPNPSVYAAGPAATQVISCVPNSIPVNGESIAIGGYTYTFKDTLTSPLDVKIDETTTSHDAPGTHFSKAMSPHPAIELAGLTSPSLTLSAKVVGHIGNSISTSTTIPSDWSFGGGRFTSGDSVTKASGTLSVTGSEPAVDGNTVKIGEKTYIFKDPLSDPPRDGEVKIGPTNAETLSNLALAINGAAHATLLNLVRAIIQDENDGSYYTGAGIPNPSAVAGFVNANTILLTSRNHTLDANEITLGAPNGSSVLRGGPFLEGGAPLTTIEVTAKQVGYAGNSIVVGKSAGLPAAWGPDTDSLVGGVDDLPTTSSEKPAFIFDWPLVGIHAQGIHLNINNVHIEGVGIGINVVQSNSVSFVTVSNVDFNHLMDASMVYTQGPSYRNYVPSVSRQLAEYPGYPGHLDRHYWQYSCGVLISFVADAGYKPSWNGKDRVLITGAAAVGYCKYILRDPVYSIDYSPFGKGQEPNAGSGTIVFYARADYFGRCAGAAPNAYYFETYFQNPDAKTYFIGPVG